jgi:hypothetical protein
VSFINHRNMLNFWSIHQFPLISNVFLFEFWLDLNILPIAVVGGLYRLSLVCTILTLICIQNNLGHQGHCGHRRFIRGKGNIKQMNLSVRHCNRRHHISIEIQWIYIVLCLTMQIVYIQTWKNRWKNGNLFVNFSSTYESFEFWLKTAGFLIKTCISEDETDWSLFVCAERAHKSPASLPAQDAVLNENSSNFRDFPSILMIPLDLFEFLINSYVFLSISD